MDTKNTIQEESVMENTPEKNTAYIFIPCSFDNSNEFKNVCSRIGGCSDWEQVHDEILYMLKFVADKFDSRNTESCQCFHYKLTAEGRAKCGIGSEDTLYVTEKHKFEEKKIPFGFWIKNVHLYVFTTSICIFAFQLVFEKNDPIWISNALYYLKKVSREIIYTNNGDEKGKTMMSMAKDSMENILPEMPLDFFFYANPSTERANVLTYIEVGLKDDYKKELFYLRRCYSEGFLYYEDEALDQKELHKSSKDINWGISPEAAVCLACPDLGREEFIHKTFYKNFNAQYLFMYILLLHQKYVLYLFLTRIGRGMYNNLQTLEDYRQKLFEFETDFVFSCVTEVPQYQNLYDRVAESFALKQMFEDVREPVIALGEIRKVEAEKREKEQESAMNVSLALISILAIFSAFTDSFQFAKDFIYVYCGETLAIIALAVAFILIIAVVICIAVSITIAMRKKMQSKGK